MKLAFLRSRLAELERRQHESPRPTRVAALSTGFAALDEALEGGWRRGALNELLVDQGPGPGPGRRGEGAGVLEAFLPAFVRARLLAWIDPRRLPYPPALAQLGFDLERLLFVAPRDAREQAWAVDLALRGGVCDMVVARFDDARGALDDTALRRLQLAAEQSGALGLLLRPAACASSPSPAAVRLAVSPLPSSSSSSSLVGSPASRGVRRRLRVVPLRCRGAAPFGGEPLDLEWSRDPLDEPAAAGLRARAPAARPESIHGLPAARRALGA
jgi:protein ImuA